MSANCTPEMVESLGLACSPDEPCPVYLEISGAEQVGNRILLAGNLHTERATLESILLVSDDGGIAWKEAHPRLPGTVLDQIQFFDFEAGWISGHQMRAGTPKDAFLLLSSDGGRTWRKREITGESRTGVVDHFWFDSRTHGLLAVDRVRASEDNFRHELWETHTGGDSWSVRQVNSEPLNAKKPERRPALRLRGDNAAGVHRLERQAGTNWSQVAVFHVSAGECRPALPVSPEAPPPEPSAEPASAAPPPVPVRPPSLNRKKPGPRGLQ